MPESNLLKVVKGRAVTVSQMTGPDVVAEIILFWPVVGVGDRP
jgi:hypothetical protein